MPRETNAAEEMWNRRYAGDGYLFGTRPNTFLTRCRDLLTPGARVLSIADGEGRNSVWLAEQGMAVDAFEPSPVAVAKAQRLAGERGVDVTFEIAGADDWTWPEESYDAVAAIFIQFAPPDLRRRIFGRIAHTLRPGGLLLLEGYRDAQLAYTTGGPGVLEQLYTEDQLRTELPAAGLTIERLAAYDADVDEGPAHSGMSALIDVVARRA